MAIVAGSLYVSLRDADAGGVLVSDDTGRRPFDPQPPPPQPADEEPPPKQDPLPPPVAPSPTPVNRQPTPSPRDSVRSDIAPVVPPSPQPVPQTPAPRPPAATPAPVVGPGRDPMATRYADGARALGGRSFREAIGIFEAIERDSPGYRDTAAQLAKAREGLLADVQAALNAAAGAETSNDLGAALDHYQRAQQIDPAAVAPATLDSLRNRMRQAKEKALVEARNYESYDRVKEAVGAYQRALQNTASGDPDRTRIQQSIDRLQALR